MSVEERKSGKTYRRRIGMVLATLAVLGVVSILGMVTYLAWLHRVASALVTSAYEIRTKADADREIAAWGKRFGKDFWQESDHPGGDHSYDAVLANLTLARLHVVQPTGVTVGITMRDGQLWSLFVAEQTGWYPVASVAVQEWFDDTIPKRVHVLGHLRPYAAWVEFPASIPEERRRRAFAFNTKCLISRRICKNEDEILPGISQLQSTAPDKRGYRRSLTTSAPSSYL
jgi:hypothetical protein